MGPCGLRFVFGALEAKEVPPFLQNGFSQCLARSPVSVPCFHLRAIHLSGRAYRNRLPDFRAPPCLHSTEVPTSPPMTAAMPGPRRRHGLDASRLTWTEPRRDSPRESFPFLKGLAHICPFGGAARRIGHDDGPTISDHSSLIPLIVVNCRQKSVCVIVNGYW